METNNVAKSFAKVARSCMLAVFCIVSVALSPVASALSPRGYSSDPQLGGDNNWTTSGNKGKKQYAANSVLAEGKWARVKVKTTGMQFLSSTQLRNLGFTDASKVNVYGYGGQLISEVLDSRQIDDLPVLPVIRTDKGILFYGKAQIGWKYNSGQLVDGMVYAHLPHCYDDASYYFISDREMDTPALKKAGRRGSGDAIKEFTERLVHDVDLDMPAVSGRAIVGEDFRTTTLRTFPFDLPDNVGGDAQVTVNFTARTTGGQSSISVSANGKALPATNSDKIAPVTGETYYCKTVTTKAVKDAGSRLNLEIKYNPGGTLFKANLDYIRVEYTRALKLSGGELQFYIPTMTDSRIEVDGCSSYTRILDITDPENPVEIDYNLSGQKASFFQAGGEYREYVAFEPASVNRAPESAGSVANQNIHAMEIPDMIIISPSLYLSQARRIAEMHERNDGMIVHVFTPEELYTEFSCGTRDVSAFRKALKMWYDRGLDSGRTTKYCLIMSRPTYDNKMLTDRYRNGTPRVPIWQSDFSPFSPTSSFSCDDFIGMVEDDKRGTFNLGSAPIKVAVGRFPVTDLQEATQMTDKLIEYVENPVYGSWRNQVILVSDDGDEKNHVHLSQSEDVYNNMIASSGGRHMLYERMYLDSYPLEFTGTGPTYLAAKNRFKDLLNSGTLYVNYIGHANPKGWTHENFFNWTDMNDLSNPRYTFMTTATCEFCAWDADELSGAEVLWLKPKAGAIGMISTNRPVYISPNGPLSSSFAKHLFELNADGSRKTVGEIYLAGKAGIRSTVSETNSLRFLIVGDPALRLPMPNYVISVDSLAGVDMTADIEDMPVLPARGSVPVSGRVHKLDGSVDEDFNGTMALSLYDAERPIETFGNSGGEPTVYNDRKTRLLMVNVPVKKGRWSTTLNLPSEIENNYSPARLVAYAYSDKGNEAHGSEERFFVYGYDENAPEDNESPELTRFTINNDNFTSGGRVNSTPLLLASFKDESGINISDAGIGHGLTLVLDGTKVLTDVVNYYVPDSVDYRLGSLSYLLPELEAGEHNVELTVWDNAGNSTKAALDFSVGASSASSIYGLGTDCNPARTSVVFSLTADNPQPGTECILQVFDLNGRKIWEEKAGVNGAADANVSMRWNLCDASGYRVPRGIYLYRASIRNSNGDEVDSQTKKLAVSAQ